MAGNIITVKRHFINLLLARNLQLYQDHRKEHGVWTPGHPYRWAIQFDPTSGRYEQALFNTNEGKYLDLRPGWKVFMIPQPSSEHELTAMKEGIAAGANPLLDPSDEYFGVVID